MAEEILGYVPDLMYPCGDGKNRNEYILVEYDDILQSAVESVFYGLILTEDYENFPVLYSMDTIDPKEFFFKYSIMDPMKFLYAGLSDEILKTPNCDEYVQSVYEKAMKIDTIRYQSLTMTMYAIRDLIHTHFVKKVLICNRRRLEEFEMLYLIGATGGKDDMFEFYHGSVADMLEDHPEVTTVFMTNLDELLMILRDPDKYHLNNGVLFSLRNSLENTSMREGVDGQDHFVEDKNDIIRELTLKKPYAVARFFLFPFTDPQDNTTNLTDQHEYETKFNRYKIRRG